MFARVEVAMRPEFPDPAAEKLLRRIELAHPDIRPKIRWARMLDVYWLDLPLQREEAIRAISDIFWDHVLQWLITGNLIPSAAGKHGSMLDIMESAPTRPGRFWAIENRFRPGVTDNRGRTAIEAFEIVLRKKIINARASSGSLLLLEGTKLDEDSLARIARDVVCNELIETWTVINERELCKSDRFVQERIKRDLPVVSMRGLEKAEQILLGNLSDTEMEKLSKKKLWALSLPEMKRIRGHFYNPRELEKRKTFGLGDPTDVELEVFAQTWSEHCKHKIFTAKINYKDDGQSAYGIPEVIDGLFKETIAGTTSQIERPWLLSVFKDNAGIVSFDDEDAFCIKVETHNTPSALDPYGGSLTGIVGVNRDILGCGLGAKPIFNTNVFCLATPDYSHELPERLLHPRRVLDGVSRGIEDGGNKSGIPTVNGALVFDDRYLGKPLIYCGTGGMLPKLIAGLKCESKNIEIGDRIFMVGGRIGKDGIHGATFSSLALDDSSPSSAVQLGDPITQKRMSDFLLEARDKGLYRAITDNGAGGLSSSIGEMARVTNGAKIDLAKAKTKYPGLRPFELIISESQERMTVAVPPDKLEAFGILAQRRGVEVSDLGEFTNSGNFEIYYEDRIVGSIDLTFLHEGVPRLQIEAAWDTIPGSVSIAVGDSSSDFFEKQGASTLLSLMERPNIASKEWLIRQYDHEVQGMSVIKPLHTAYVGTAAAKSGPNDASVIKPKLSSTNGIAVACGINPKLSDYDPYLMAQAAVDEAVRNLMCVGADFGKKESFLALVDNFCWADPTVDKRMAGALVRACYGLRDAALALEAPLISGKDSMKNDFHGSLAGKMVHIAVPPTLLITAVAKVRDVYTTRTAEFKARGDQIYLISGAKLSLIGSEFWADERSKGIAGTHVLPQPDWSVARRIYSWLGRSLGKEGVKLRSVHDVSEGGVLVAVAESAIARGLGVTLEVKDPDIVTFSFGEGFHSFIASAAETDAAGIEAEMQQLKIPFIKIGAVTGGDKLQVKWGSALEKSWSLDIKTIRSAWQKDGYWQ